jgi:hypothetical protein
MGLDIPLGTQGAELLDTRYYDEDPEDACRQAASTMTDEEIIDDPEVAAATTNGLRTEADFRDRAAKAYTAYSGPFKNRFKWLPSNLFHEKPGQ